MFKRAPTQPSSNIYLIRPLHEPVDGAAVDNRREHSETRSERFPQGRHAQHDVNVGPHAVDVLSAPRVFAYEITYVHSGTNARVAVTT